MLYHMKGALQVGVEHLVVIVLFNREKQAVPRHPGVVHQNVDAAQLFRYGRNSRLGLAVAGHVAAHSHRAHTQRPHGLANLFGLLLLAGVHHGDVGSLFGQAQRNGPPDPPGTAGHQRDLSL